MTTLRSLIFLNCLIITFMFGIEIKGFCQYDKNTPPPLNEFTASLNRYILYGDKGNFEAKIGFGVGIYRSWFEQKRVNLIAGISYNNYLGFSKSYYYLESDPGDFFKDAKYKLHNLSIPVSVRFNVGKFIKYFMELGFYFNYNIHESVKGLKDSKFVKKSSSPAELPIDTGCIGGIGLKIPLKKNGLIIKTYYNQSVIIGRSIGVINLSFGYQLL